MRMMEVKILGVTRKAALLNPKVAKKFEEHITSTVTQVKEAAEAESSARAIEMQCSAIIAFLDDIFGAGSAKEVLGEETDLLTCMEAWRDITNLYREQVMPVINGLTVQAMQEQKERQGEA